MKEIRHRYVYLSGQEKNKMPVKQNLDTREKKSSEEPMYQIAADDNSVYEYDLQCIKEKMKE